MNSPKEECWKCAKLPEGVVVKGHDHQKPSVPIGEECVHVFETAGGKVYCRKCGIEVSHAKPPFTEVVERFDEEKFVKKWQAKYEVHPADLRNIAKDITQALTEQREEFVRMIEVLENPFKPIFDDKSMGEFLDLAEWAYIEGGKQRGFERMRDDLLTKLKEV